MVTHKVLRTCAHSLTHSCHYLLIILACNDVLEIVCSFIDSYGIPCWSNKQIPQASQITCYLFFHIWFHPLTRFLFPSLNLCLGRFSKKSIRFVLKSWIQIFYRNNVFTCIYSYCRTCYDIFRIFLLFKKTSSRKTSSSSSEWIFLFLFL